MLCAGHGSVLPDAVDLHLELVGLAASVLMLQQGLLEVLRGVEVPRQLLVGEVVRLLLKLWVDVIRGIDLGGVVKVLRMLGLQLAFVGVGTRAEHVLWQWTSEVHLRLYEGLWFLQIDLLGRHGRGDHAVTSLLLHLEQVVHLLVCAHCLPRGDIDRVSCVVG